MTTPAAPRTAAVEELRAYIYAIHVEGNIGGTAMQYIDTQLDAIEAEDAAGSGSLDVEALRQAMHATSRDRYHHSFERWSIWAQAIVVEYARLLRERETAEEPSHDD